MHPLCKKGTRRYAFYCLFIFFCPSHQNNEKGQAWAVEIIVVIQTLLWWNVTDKAGRSSTRRPHWTNCWSRKWAAGCERGACVCGRENGAGRNLILPYFPKEEVPGYHSNWNDRASDHKTASGPPSSPPLGAERISCKLHSVVSAWTHCAASSVSVCGCGKCRNAFV